MARVTVRVWVLNVIIWESVIFTGQGQSTKWSKKVLSTGVFYKGFRFFSGYSVIGETTRITCYMNIRVNFIVTKNVHRNSK